MTTLLAEIPVAIVSIDEQRFPDRDAHHILEHLLRYCAKFDPMPAITVSVESGVVTVVRGHKYLIVARKLGRQLIRAVIMSSPSSEAVKVLLARPDVTVLDWKSIKTREAEEPNPKIWHVFFFARSLSANEQRDFSGRVAELFRPYNASAIPVIYNGGGAIAEFEANTPVTDHSWGTRSLAAFSSFSQERVDIVSYQGARFGPVDRVAR